MKVPYGGEWQSDVLLAFLIVLVALFFILGRCQPWR